MTGLILMAIKFFKGLTGKQLGLLIGAVALVIVVAVWHHRIWDAAIATCNSAGLQRQNTAQYTITKEGQQYAKIYDQNHSTKGYDRPASAFLVSVAGRMREPRYSRAR